MGGNALSEPGVRLGKDVYLELERTVLNKLKSQLDHVRWSRIPAYTSKTSYGDMDIVYSHRNPAPAVIIEAAAETIAAREIVPNGPVTSLGIQAGSGTFQIDLIQVPRQSHDFARRYFSYNDLGNLIGRVAHFAGFKFGHLGLQYVVREPGNNAHVITELDVTTDWSEALEFLGYSPAQYDTIDRRGFSSLDEVFKFASSSKYYSPEIFQLANIGHQARTRDRKRPTYRAFLEWMSTSASRPAFSWAGKDAIRNRMLVDAKARFPGFKTNYDTAIAQQKRMKAFKLKFNGQLVSGWTGLSGRDLGGLMKELKSDLQYDQLVSWVLSANTEEIKQWVENTHNRRQS